MKNLFRRFRHDITGIATLASALFLGLSLGSYNPLDPSLNSFSTHVKVQNFCGYVGSFLADLMYQLFGLGAWVFVVGLAFVGISSFRGHEISFREVRWAWGGLLLLVVISLLGLHFPGTKVFSQQVALGGIVGMALSKALVAAFNFTGTALLLWSIAAVLVVFYSEKSIKEISSGGFIIFKEKLGFARLLKFFRGSLESLQSILEGLKPLPAASGGRGATARPPKNTDDFIIEERLQKQANSLNNAVEEEVAEDIEPLDLADELQKESIEEDAEANEPKRQTRRKVVMKVKPPRRIEKWEMPKLGLLEDPPAARFRVDKDEIKRKAELLTQKLEMFNVKGVVVGFKPGPAVTMFEFKPNADVKLSKITELADDLSIALSSESVRIIAPIPGRDVVGIETSNSQRETVYVKDLLAEESFWKEDHKLPIALGRQANGEPQIVDLRKMPHLLVAGSTGSGKSVFVVSSIVGLLFRHSPKTLRMILIDPKQVDLAAFNKVPHLLMPPIVEPTKAVAALRWAVKEMEKRYKSMNKFGARNLEAFNEAVAELNAGQVEEHEKINEELEINNKKNQKYYYQPLPYIVVVVEEFGDLMQVDKNNVEQAVVRLAQLARACGIHLVLAMQSPRKEILTGLIKTNIPGRISFKVASKLDSRVILDDSGAERLLARGDMLFLSPGTAKPLRHHGPWLSDPEINELAEFWSNQAEPEFDPLALKALEGLSTEEGGTGGFGDDEDSESYDAMYDEIVDYVSSVKEVSASLLQRRFRLGYPRAARLIEIMEREGVVGPANGSKPRQVLVNSFK